MPNTNPAVEGASAPVDDPRETHWENRSLSQERDARKATLATLIAETVTREITKATRDIRLAATLRVNSGVNGFRVMDPFDWTFSTLAAVVREG